MPTAYRFHEFRLDCKNWTLYRGTSRIDLQPKIIDTLTYLVAHAGEVVSNEELMRNVWPSVVVEINSLNRCISTIRTALGDDPPYRYIQTFKNQGYCFIAPVHIENNAGSNTLISRRTDVINLVTSFRQQKKTIHYLLAIGLALSIAGLFAWQFGMKLNAAIPAFVTQQLTFNSADLPITGARISPDGNKLVFIESNKVYISDIHSIERHLISLPDTITPIQVDWFPDGLHLLISSYIQNTPSYSHWRVSILDAQASVIIEDGLEPSISPSGDQIAFMRNNGSELWIADSHGQHQQLVESGTHNGQLSGIVQFSRDDRYLLTMEIDLVTRHSVIKARDRSTGQVKTIFESDAPIGCFVLLADGELLFSRYMNLTSRSVQLLTSRIDLDTGRYSIPRVVTTFPGDNIDELSATDDGNNILLVRSRTQSDIYLAPLTTEGVSISAGYRFTLNDSNDQPAAWIDNNTILMSSDRTGLFNIFSIALNTSEVITLASGDHDYLRPVLSANHKWLFYFVRNKSGSGAIVEMYRKSLRDGSTKLMHASNDGYLGLRCAFKSDNCVLAEHQLDNCTFYDFDPQQGLRKQLSRTKWSANAAQYSWDLSLDGKQIAFIDTVNGKDAIGIFSLDQSPVAIKRMKLGIVSQLRTLTWDAMTNGFYISAYTDTGELFTVVHAGLDGSTTPLRNEMYSQDGWAIPSPNGKLLAYQQYSTQRNIWLMQRKQPAAIVER